MHILLFILIFIIAIVVFGLSIIGFLLRTIFGIGRRSSSSSSRPNQTESGRTATGQQATVKTLRIWRIMKRKYTRRMYREEDTRKYSRRMTVNMWTLKK